MILYKYIKVVVNETDIDTDFFDIVAGIMQADKPSPYMLIICQNTFYKHQQIERKKMAWYLKKKK